MSCPSIITILPTECIGNSLAAINSNFENLETAACDNSGTITTLQQNIQQLNTLITNLSAITVPGTAKAWVKFDGARDIGGNISTLLGPRFIYSSYNINSIIKKAPGDYRIEFENRQPSPNYAVIGTSQQTPTSTNNFTWLQPYRYTSLFVEIRTFSNLNEGVDPRNISVVIF
jgi:hypothetical protein